MIDQLLVSVEEAAEALSIGRSQTFELIRSGELRSITVGRRRLVPVNALEDWLASRLATPAGESTGNPANSALTSEPSIRRALREVV